MRGLETSVEELQERVRQALRDRGYYLGQADPPKVSSLKETPNGRFAEITVVVNPGAVYTLGDIRFEGGRVFPAETMRAQFSTRSGETFNATEISKGLEKLKDLYASKGYINFGTIPKPAIDETAHLVELTMDIDEGRAVSFGALRLEGLERWRARARR